MTQPLLMVAGEASGDLHGARLLAELRRLRPQLETFGLGGDELEAAGLERLAHSSEVAVVGITEVLRVLPRARQIFRQILDEVDRRKPAVAVLVDFPEFNLRLARELRRRGVPVVYYVSPQIWAWRRGRVKAIAQRVDKMLVLFPFEVDFYSGYDVEAVHVGHPLVDEVPQLPHVWEKGAPEDGRPFEIALLPGSRPSEVEKLLPVMLDAFRQLADRLPVLGRLIQAPTVSRASLEEAVSFSRLPIEVVGQRRFERIAASHLAICASGTATLEVGLLGTPMVVVYRVGSWTYRLARLLVHLDYISLVNLVLGEGAVPELLQDEANPAQVAAEGAAILRSAERVGQMRQALARLRPSLGVGGASSRAAAEVASYLPSEPPADREGATP